ncbi:ABC transporter ATP-binding protein [Phyllobacterium endophyticum]|uniref:Spermidine/putrescine import ATP-binding protein PotA n=2 Tax=Phyllobacterium endophyticum TaxID=1149773 RepID=A0A2P7ASJ7_9HYPH|nr:polyamine ABC transporter ATP-binding protein [Phyllobacterium endophyticum]TYR44560.1 ABC transporter ATP-binding protein [Phyllobacterium endophyticum]
MVFGDYRAVDDASFDLQEGKFLTILGPSGSGKTTLLRMIAGFQAPTSGEIAINGIPVGHVPPNKRSIGMVFQKLALFPHMTAAQNVAFPLKMRRFDARTIPARVAKYLDLVKLGGFANRRIHELSGGQQQRIAIARALVFEPDLLLLDEPLAALDRKLREEMQLEFRRIQRELGVTTINVTHDQREALVVSDEIIVMDKGRIQQNAKPSATYRQPSNSFVAGFIGVTNFLSGSVTDVTDSEVAFIAGTQPLCGRWVATDVRPSAGQSVKGAVRAEQIRVAATPDRLDDLQTTVAGSVMDVIFEGERVVYEVRLASLQDATIRVFDHDPSQHAEFEAGARVFVGWNARDVLVFAE